jgi:hypothetical protein
MNKRAYSNDNTPIVPPALKSTEVNQKQFSLIQLGKVIEEPSGYHASFSLVSLTTPQAVTPSDVIVVGETRLKLAW